MFALLLAAGTGDERGVGLAESAGGGDVAARRPLLHVRADRLGEEDGVGRHPVVGPDRAGDARVERADVGVERVGADDGDDVVVGVVGLERADDGELVREPGEPGHRVAEADAGEGGLRGAGDGADRLRGVGLRVEGLELARPALLEEEDDRLARDGLRPLRRRGEQGRQRQPAEAQRAEREEAPAADARISRRRG